MKTRGYNQFCALAVALDAVGERWTLLIIRELLAGPRRFKDLMDGLPGISSNLLAERLKHLEALGIICRRTLPPPAGSSVYELTPFGMELEKAVLELGRWGSRLLPSSLEGVHMPTMGSTALAIKAFFHPDKAHELHETFELRIGNETLQVFSEGGELLVRQGTPRKPDVILQTDMEIFMGLFSGRIQPEEALANNQIQVQGDPGALARFLKISCLPLIPR